MSLDSFARARYVAAKPSGERVQFEISISAPEPHPEGDFYCSITLGDAEPTETGGIDPIQVLALAVFHLRQALERLESDGWSFYHPDDDSEPLDLLCSLFPGSKPWPWESPEADT